MTRAPLPDAVYPDTRRHAPSVEQAHLRLLREQFLLPDAAGREVAVSAAEAWAAWRVIKAEVDALAARRRGRARRTTRARLRRREALEWQRYERSVQRLADLAGRHEVRPSRRWSRRAS